MPNFMCMKGKTHFSGRRVCQIKKIKQKTRKGPVTHNSLKTPGKRIDKGFSFFKTEMLPLNVLMLQFCYDSTDGY